VNSDNQLLFFFSAIGAFNGFILAFYFFYSAYSKRFSNYFLGFLLLALSIRIVKSLFFYFNDDLSDVFIQIGLSGCILIGPFLFLYLKKQNTNNATYWAWHVFPYLIGITTLGIMLPYTKHRSLWSIWIVKGIYLQWFFYIALSFPYVKEIFKTVFNKNEKLKNIQLWQLSVYLGVAVIWLAYYTASYTSYIVGALSFSFVIYLIALLLVFRTNKNTTFFEEKIRYEGKKLDNDLLTQIEQKLSLITEKELYLNPQLTLADTAKELNVTVHILSQVINEKFNKSFNVYINELRIERAKMLLINNNKNFTIEGVGYESGFNSKSSFFTIFKKMTGLTPAEYQKTQGL
jgi:AraC-like DNA-binding protein